MCSEPFQELSASSTYATHMSVLIPAERQLKNPQSASHCTKSDACMPSRMAKIHQDVWNWVSL